jgi:hypothetical protein
MKMTKINLVAIPLLFILVLSSCGVSQTQHTAVVAERDSVAKAYEDALSEQAAVNETLDQLLADQKQKDNQIASLQAEIRELNRKLDEAAKTNTTSTSQHDEVEELGDTAEIDGKTIEVSDLYGRFVITDHLMTYGFARGARLEYSDKEIDMMLGNVVAIQKNMLRTYMSHRRPENHDTKPNYIRIVEYWQSDLSYRFVKKQDLEIYDNFGVVSAAFGNPANYTALVATVPLADESRSKDNGRYELNLLIKDINTLYMLINGETFKLERVDDDYPDKPTELLEE